MMEMVVVAGLEFRFGGGYETVPATASAVSHPIFRNSTALTSSIMLSIYSHLPLLLESDSLLSRIYHIYPYTYTYSLPSQVLFVVFETSDSLSSPLYS